MSNVTEVRSEYGDQPLVVDLGAEPALVHALCRSTNGRALPTELRHFPDDESWLRFGGECAGRQVIVATPFDRPNSHVMAVLIAADTLRELGASRVGLVSPYLPYMRQDERFEPGECVSSRTFGALISSAYDWLVTVDPHLHRYAALDAVYSIPTTVVRSAPAVAAYIRRCVQSPVVIGPDAESEQWVADVARLAGCPSVVLEKIRRGDRDVDVSVPDVAAWPGATPVLLDDIISTGCTMAAALRHLSATPMRPPICIGVHGVFADGAVDALTAAGASRIVTTDTIPGRFSEITVADRIAEAVALQASAASGEQLAHASHQ